MNCPNCSRALQEVGKFWVCPEHGPVSPETAASIPDASGGDRRQLVLTRFPFPIAWGYQQVVEPESASHAVDCVFYTYTAVLRFTALVFLSQFLRGPRQSPEAAKAVQQLQNPHLENWYTAVNTLAKHLFPPLDPAGLRFAPLAEGGPLYPGLAAAAWGLKRLKSDGVPLHDAMRNARNARAHGAPWDEAECAKRLPDLRRLLEQVLDLFAPLAEVELLRRSPGGLVRLRGAAEAFAEEPVADVRLEALLEDSGCAVEGPGGDALPLYPLFLPQEDPPQGYTEPLLVFDGHGRKNAVYLGVRSRTERQDALARYLDLLKAKDIDPRFTKEKLAPWSVAQWARETSLGSVDALRGVKYFPAFYEERRTQKARTKGEDSEGAEGGLGVDDEVARWLDRRAEPALIMAAEAGSGKTSLLCRLTEKLTADPLGTDEREERADCVLLLLASAVRGEETLFDRIREGLGFSDDPSRGGIARFDELLDAWHQVGSASDAEHGRRRLVLLVDAVNEAEDPKKLFEQLSELAAQAAVANQKAGRAWVRLLATVRAERIETLLNRWQERSDTPFLAHPQNFAKFQDERGKEVPYLPLRRFTTREAEAAYQRAGQALPRSSCPAAWASLSQPTRDLLRHPLMVLLFHQAFAGVAQPPAVAAVDAVWERWLERTFHADHGGQYLEKQALALADRCLDEGHRQLPAELVAEWRARWQAEQGNDPIRIAAGMDDLERLAEAGLVRPAEGGAWDWVSDSLSEQVLCLALRRRDPALTEASLERWLALPRTARLDGALARVGLAVWSQGRPLGLRPYLGAGYSRGKEMVGRVLTAAAPRGAEREIAEAVGTFGKGLAALGEWCVAAGNARPIDLLMDALLWEVGKGLEDRWGAAPARKAAALCCVQVAEKLAALEPDNTSYLRGLSVSYNKMGGMDERRDPTKAREWYEKALGIAEKLAALEPDNTLFLHDLSVSYNKMGGMDERRDPTKACEWYEKALGIAEKLAALEPDNTLFLHVLSVSYDRMGGMDERLDPTKAREWYEKDLGVAEKLAALEPDNTSYLRGLSVSYNKMGGMDERRDPAKAREWYEKALGIAEKLAALEPDNTSYLRDLSVSYNKMGGLDERRDPAKAREWYEKALGIAEKLAALEPDSFQAWKDAAGALSRHAERALELGDVEEERRLTTRFVEAARRAADLAPDNSGSRYDLACALARVGDVCEALTALAECARLGWFDADHAVQDADLRSLRGLPEFEAILMQMRANASGEE